MKLYQYDHCPFCVRADMVAGYRKIPHEKVYLLNDDEQAHYDLIGAKMVPILEFDDGRAMGESLDIVAEFNRMQSDGLPLGDDDGTEAQRARLSEINQSINCLLFPRNVRLGLPEFATEGAIAYFTERKEQIIGMSFDEAFAETRFHKRVVEDAFRSMPELPHPGDQLSMGDVLFYPNLRNLTMVRDLAFPDWTRRYIDAVTAICGTHTYDDCAI